MTQSLLHEHFFGKIFFLKFFVDTILPLIANEYEEDDNSTIEETIRTK